MTLFLMAIVALVLIGLIADVRWALGTALLLLANSLVQRGMIWYCEEPFPWLFFIVTDYLSALCVLAVSRNRWNIAVVTIYSVQLIAHAAYGYLGASALHDWNYYWTLYYTGWSQLVMVTGGIFAHVLRRRGGVARSVSSAEHVL